MNKGFVIAFEGGEGSGKSTAIAIFEQKLKERGFNVKTYAEPGGTRYSNEIRELFFNYPDLSVETAVHLMNSQRQDNIERLIKPYVEQGYIVLIDRFIASTIVYQGILSNQLGGLLNKQDQLEWVLLNSLAYDHTVFFFDCDPDISIPRVRARKTVDTHFDALDMRGHHVIHTAYNRVLNQLEKTKTNPQWTYVPGCSNVTVINANETLDNVADQLEQEAIKLSEKFNRTSI